MNRIRYTNKCNLLHTIVDVFVHSSSLSCNRFSLHLQVNNRMLQLTNQKHPFQRILLTRSNGSSFFPKRLQGIHKSTIMWDNWWTEFLIIITFITGRLSDILLQLYTFSEWSGIRYLFYTNHTFEFRYSCFLRQRSLSLFRFSGSSFKVWNGIRIKSWHKQQTQTQCLWDFSKTPGYLSHSQYSLLLYILKAISMFIPNLDD